MPGLGDARLVRIVHDAGYDHAGENTENDDHDHDLDQRKAALAACASNVVKSDFSITVIHIDYYHHYVAPVRAGLYLH